MVETQKTGWKQARVQQRGTAGTAHELGTVEGWWSHIMAAQRAGPPSSTIELDS